MAIEQHRIEAARKTYPKHGMIGDLRRNPISEELLVAVLNAAFPELAAGTAWVAPVEVTETGNVGVSIIDFGILPDAHTKDRTRDAHLSKGKDDDG